MTQQPIKLYGKVSAPNPWKVAILLEELKVPYTWIPMNIPRGDTKREDFVTHVNPNGRIPAIQDPNTNITLWESGAILEYLIETYDKSGQLTYTSSPERYYLKQWLCFQVSGQGPYYGQAVWFSHTHPEKLKSAIVRYQKEVERVIMVLNKHLDGREWLVGDKCTYVDLSFVSWDMALGFIFSEKLGDLEIEKNYPHYFKWNKAMTERPSVQKIMSDKKELDYTPDVIVEFTPEVNTPAK